VVQQAAYCTYHKVSNDSEQNDGENALWQDIAEEFSEEVSGRAIIATDRLMSVTTTDNINIDTTQRSLQ